MTVVFSGGLPRSVREVTPGYERWGADVVGDLTIDSRYATMAYEAIYRNQPGVFSVINRLLEGICRIPIKVYQFGADGESRERVREHPLAKLMTEPWEGHSQWELKERLGFDLLLHGKALAWKLRPGPGRPPREVWPIPWWCVVPISDARGVIAYQIYLGDSFFTLAPEDCVYLELVGHGTSPIEPLRRQIGIEDRAMEWQDQALAGGLSAKAVFTTKVNLRETETVSAIRAQLDKLYTGPSGSQYAVLGQDSDVKVLQGLSASDIGLITVRQSSREDVCSCYGVNPAVMGFTTSEGKADTYASAREWRQAFYVDGVGGKVTLFQELLQAQLVRRELTWSDVFVEFDTTGLLMPDAETLARADLMDMQSGTTVANERRRRRNLRPIGDPNDPANPANLPWQAGNGYPLGSEPKDMGASIKAPAGQALSDALIVAAVEGGTPTERRDDA